MNGEVDPDLIDHHELRPFSHSQARFTFSNGSDCKPSGGVIRIFAAFLLLCSIALFLVGIAFCAIFFNYSNYHGCVWAFLTGSISMGNTTLYVIHLISKLDNWHSRATLEGVKLFGMIMCFISVIALCTYFILGFLDKQEFDLHGVNFFSAASFSGLALASSLFLYFSAQWYQNAIQIVLPEIPMSVPVPMSLWPNSAVIN